MDYPRGTSEFISWVKQQDPDTLVELQLDLLATVANIQVQLQDHTGKGYTVGPNGSKDWETKARTKLRLTEWRLEVVGIVLHASEEASLKFQQAAKRLLDPDTYEVILESAGHHVRAN